MHYDISELGSRIAARRKEMQLTQEALAQRLGVSPQAISKWETGGGCPDIATLPVLSTVLGMSLDELFGLSRVTSKVEAKEEITFPEKINEIPLAASYKNCACYSNLPIAEVADNLVRFENGSTANLLNREIINKGDGKIFLLDSDSLPLEEEAEEAASNEKSESGFSFDSVALDMNSAVKISILPGEGSGSWKADGSYGFMSRLSVVQENDCLCIREDAGRRRGISFFHFGNFFNSGEEREKNRIEIRVPAPKLQALSGALNGVGKLTVGLDVEGLDLSVNGNVNVETQAIEGGSFRLNGAGKQSFAGARNTKFVLSGAGTIQVLESRDCKLRLDGAGNIRIQEAFGTLKAKLGGVGNISVAGGHVDELELRLSGAGNFKGEGLEVREADISIPGVGQAVVGAILGESREKVSGLGKLKVLQRS